MKAIKQTERKTLVYEYHRAQAVTRSYAPQALIGVLVEDLTAGDGHFLEVDLDDEFFRSLEVRVEVMTELQNFALRSLAVALEYGDEADPRSHRHDDLIFDATTPSAQNWVVPIGPDFDLSYRPRIEYHFDPASDWVGETNEVVIEPGSITDRTLQLDPTAHIGFLDVEIRPDRLDPLDVSSVEVMLTHEASTGWNTSQTFVVQADSAPQRWRVRTAGEDERSYQVTRRYNLTDGGTVVLSPEVSDATRVAVGTPFASRLNRRIDFTVPDGAFSSAIIDIDYEDVDHNFTASRRLELSGAALSTTHVQFGVVDASLRTTTTQATLIGADGSVVRGAALVGDFEFLTVAVDGSITGV